MCIFCERAQAQLADGITPSQIREAEQCERLQERRVKATILTGFLGAGKTTFLNFVLGSLKHGQRVAVVQNEFGSVSVDDQLMPVERSNTEVVVMPNGCLCCRVRGDLVDALRRLAARTLGSSPPVAPEVAAPGASEDALPPLDGLIIECSGLSEVAPVAQTFFADPYVQASYRLDGVVCVCDSANFEACEDGEVGTLLREQLALSDVCLLNKCDLIDSKRRDALGAKIRAVNPGTKVVPCRHGKVNLTQVLKIGSFSLETALALDPHFLDGGGAAGHGDGGHGHGEDMHDDSNHGHVHNAFGSIGIEIDGEIDLNAFRAWMRGVVEQHGSALMRVKGVLRTAGKRAIVQGVGGHIEIGEEADAAGAGAAGASRLVFIGRLDFKLSADLRAGFASTAASAVAAAPAVPLAKV